MRIIGGRFRGKQLQWVSDQTTRPTTDRVKENVFNVLTSMDVNFAEARVLCLFSGSGQMGIECISRGATDVIFNDIDKNAVEVIKKNLGHAKIPLSNERGVLCLNLDYVAAIEKLCGQKFELVFLDPPFVDIDAPWVAVEKLVQYEMLSPHAVIVCETQTPGLEFPGFDVKFKKYGRAVIYFLKLVDKLF